MQSDGLNSALSPVVHGDIALSINTQYNRSENFCGLFLNFCSQCPTQLTDPRLGKGELGLAPVEQPHYMNPPFSESKI